MEKNKENIKSKIDENIKKMEELKKNHEKEREERKRAEEYFKELIDTYDDDADLYTFFEQYKNSYKKDDIYESHLYNLLLKEISKKNYSEYEKLIKEDTKNERKKALKYLGLPENSTQEEIKKKFRELSLKYHPDKNPKGKERYQKIVESYKILGGNIFNKAFEIVTNLPKRAYQAVIEGPRDDFPPDVRKKLKEYGNQEIVKMEVCRTAIQGAVKKLVNYISLGSIGKQEYYDDIFHLYLIIHLKNKKTLRLEKNHVITLTNYNGKVCGLNVPITKSLTLNDLINNAVKNVGNSIYHYSAETNNCQNFQLNLLKYSGLLNKELEEFIHQDASKILLETPSISKKLINVLTNIAERADILIQGKGHDEIIREISKAVL